MLDTSDELRRELERARSQLRDVQGENARLRARIETLTSERGEPGSATETLDATRARLEASETRYRALFDCNATVKWIVDPATGAIVDANPAACELYGRTRAELTAMHVQDIDVRAPEEIFAELSRARRERHPCSRVAHRMRGGMREVEVSAGPIEIDGRALVLVIVQDPSLRLQADRALEESERRFRAMIQNAADAILVFGADGTILFETGDIMPSMGWSLNERIGTSFFANMHPEDADWARRMLSRLVNEAGAKAWAQLRSQAKDGSWRWLEGTATNLLFEPSVRGIVVNYRDVTTRRQAEESIRSLAAELERRVEERTGELVAANAQLEAEIVRREKMQDEVLRLNEHLAHRASELAAANAELEAFAYSVSHDLRAPVRSIDGFSSLFLEEYGHAIDDAGREYLARVGAATERMGELIDDLLALSRIARSQMRREQVDLSRLARAAADQLSTASPGRAIDFDVEPDVDALGDSRLLRIVLENLIGNAVKFTRGRQRARIEFGRRAVAGKQAYFVRDDGVGFDMAHSDKLFQPFQRLVHPSEYEGTGIGLATVKRIVQRHGGDVWAEARPGQGATFWFTLATAS